MIWDEEQKYRAAVWVRDYVYAPLLNFFGQTVIKLIKALQFALKGDDD